MQKRRLGSFTTSALGLGCMGFSQGFGPAEDSESVQAIRTAVDSGVRLLDTAMTYGQGHNEQLVAKALASCGADANQVQIATKFGIVRDAAGVRVDGMPEHVAGYCDASLRRLSRDVIDLYYMHRADPQVPVAETIGAMGELVAAGKVRHLGISEFTAPQIVEAASVHKIDAIQFEWSLLWREPERDVIPTAREHQIGLVPYSPLGHGLLTATLDHHSVGTSDFRRNDPRFQGETLDINFAQVAALRAIAESLGITAAQLALAWLMSQGDDVVPIPGTRKPARVAENAAAASLRLSPENLRELDQAVPPSGWVGDRQSFAVPSTTRSAA